MPCLQTVRLVRVEVLADEHCTAYPNYAIASRSEAMASLKITVVE
jgi:hypothetical protein